MNKKIYIAGAGGMLGKAFYEIFNNDYELKLSDKDVNESWLSFLDFRDKEKYFDDVCNFKPDYLFHLGAYTDLEFCEENKDDAYLTNTIAVETAISIANKLNIPLLYISTAGIFDGSKDIFDDWDVPNPLGVYARSKYLGERSVIENCNEYIIVRAGWMMGGGRTKDKKFISKIISQLESGKKTLNIVNDRDGTPTYTIDFANNVREIIESGNRGLFNLVCAGQTSRKEVTEEILSILGLTNKVSINLVESTFFKNEYFAERPTSERLINYRLQLLNLDLMRDWRVCLKEYLKKDFNLG